MKKTNIIILLIAVIAALVLGVFFITSMMKEKEEIDVDEQVVIENPTSENPVEEPEPTPVASEVSTGVEVGNQAPDFTLENLQGEKVSLSDYKGKHIYLNFWATWCKYCDIEMPDLQKLYEGNDDMVVLAVDVMENKKDVQAYIDDGGYNFPVLLDSDGEVSEQYLVGGLPTTYFINKEGIILAKLPGMMTFQQMEEILNEMRQLED